ncbi:hypothetical protein HK102_011493 [Quaeritorhiza haematococci]|nr:hypothetical protein HK102_011493 [Quaeritorhiza haematococci]
MSRDYLNHLGFFMIFTAIILKEYRLYRIFNNKSAAIIKLPDEVLLRYYIGAIPISLLILFLNTFTNGFRLREHSRQIDELTTEAWSVCGVSSLSYILLALEFVMLAIGSVFAWLTRNVRDEYNEARSLGFSVYNSLFLLIVAVVLQSVMMPTYESTTATIVGAMCAPKLAPGVFSKFTSSVATRTGKKLYNQQGVSVGVVSSVPSHFATKHQDSKDLERVGLLKELEASLKEEESQLIKEVHDLKAEISELKKTLNENS